MTDEESLDPESWSEMRRLGHRMVDDAMDYLEHVRERPVWQPVPESAKQALKRPLPVDGKDAAAVYEDFRRDVFPHTMGNIHPRFWGWVIGTGTPFGVLADMLASTMNPNIGGGDQGPNYVEVQVMSWLKEMLGYPADASGLLVSGGSMANFVGIAVARNAKAEGDVAREGLKAAPRPMVLYASTETHNSVHKAVSLLGLGRDALREIPVDDSYRVDVAALRRAIAEDRKAGRHPFCVVGNAGTVNTGAIDALPELADICKAENLWFHVDGAFGALAAIAPGLQTLVRGMERADSVAFDLHKWMYMPYEVGCALVRWPEKHRSTFVSPADYLAHLTRGLPAGPIWFSEYGVQLSRGFRALKVWMSLKEHGVAKYGRLVRQNCDQARYLEGLVEATPELELMAPVSLNIVCFRFAPEGIDEARLNSINEEILFSLQESGAAVPSSTMLSGRFSIRVCICNHRTRREDLEFLVREVVQRGRAIAAEPVPRA
ncbi:MAG TPA: pyridoxal-dependent decarboxylase [Candidatus Limnocylindrales bacterium]|nr:pyridoxal-dependent decarboxylase [Candidatus Limnocylindrales bacterium]